MRLILLLSDCMIPIVVFLILGVGVCKKVEVFDEFVIGAKDGFKVVLEILPTIIGLMIAVSVLRTSGFLDFLTKLLTPVAEGLSFPVALIPMSLMRTVSASATTGLVLDLFKTYGPDSLIGRMASIIMGSTETIFYTMSIYFTTINIKKTRYTLGGALLVTLAGMVAAVLITYYVF